MTMNPPGLVLSTVIGDEDESPVVDLTPICEELMVWLDRHNLKVEVADAVAPILEDGVKHVDSVVPIGVQHSWYCHDCIPNRIILC